MIVEEMTVWEKDDKQTQVNKNNLQKASLANTLYKVQLQTVLVTT